MVTCYHTVPDIAPTIMLIRDSPLYLVQLMVGFASSKMNAIINNQGTDAILILGLGAVQITNISLICFKQFISIKPWNLCSANMDLQIFHSS